MARVGRQFFTADTMFGDDYAATERQFKSADEMDEHMIGAWNAVVGTADTVWILGNFHSASLIPRPELLRALHGSKYLVAGELDAVFAPNALDAGRLRTRVKFFREQLGFTGVVTGSAIARKTGRPLVLPLRPRRDMPPETVIVSHFPYDLTEHEKGKQDRFGTWRPKRPRGEGAPWLLHGHNADWVVNEHQVNVGADAWGFEPVGADMIVALIEDNERGM